MTPPIRDGVSASTLVLPALDMLQQKPLNLLSFLEQSALNSYRLDWESRFKNGLILDAQGQALSIDTPYTPGQRIYYWRDAGDEPRVPFEEQIVYQDEHVLIADKPHFLPVAPTGRYVLETLLVRLRKRTGLLELAPIHRIDRDTAGLVLFSVRKAERGAYMRLFRERRVLKVYECIAAYDRALEFPLVRKSRLEESPASFMQMREVPGVPNSETRIELIETLGNFARYRLEPRTGKRHQLRVHMNALGLPIYGDGIYPVLQPENIPPDYHQPLLLLAKQLVFEDPLTGQTRNFESRLKLNPIVVQDACAPSIG